MLLLWSPVGRADPADTRDALDRLGELLELRIEDGLVDTGALEPAILVRAQPRYEESAGWFATSAIEVVQRVVGPDNLRLCEACMAPRAFVGDGQMTYQTGPIGLDEVIRLDEQTRGSAPPARSAIWMEEHANGVAMRIVELSTGRLLFAQNVDPNLIEKKNSQRTYRLAAELERRAKQDGLTQAFVDFALYPGQHVSLDWTDQWGKTNANLTGVSISLFDPIVGIGACHYRRIGVLNSLVGAKVIVAIPTVLTRSLGQDVDIDLFDPLLTVVGVARVPIGRSNYGAVLTASTNGQIGLGISLLNIQLLPVIP
jgi:hypothetical protein